MEGLLNKTPFLVSFILDKSIDRFYLSPLAMDEVFEPVTIDVQVDNFVKIKAVSRCKDEFLNVLCEDSDEEPMEGERENARVEVDDEKNTEESSEEHSDEDEIVYSIHNPKVKWNVMKPVIRERYESSHQLKLCLINYSIYKDTVRLVVVCANDPEKCPFMMSTEKSFQVKKMNDRHTCGRNFSSSRLMNPTWLAKQFVKELVRKPKLKCKEMLAIIQSKFHCKTTTFHRIYVCFKAIKDGWKIGCRRVIGLDRCFLKGQCKSELLTAISRDEINQIYPIAWVLWMLKTRLIGNVSEDLSLDADRGLCVISDQHKGPVEATKEILPHVEHMQCARHIYANFRKVYSRIQFRNMFWAVAKSTTEGAHDHLMAREPHTWCMSFFGSILSCESIENGIAECFNAVIVDARKKPHLTMLEEIKLYMMERLYNLREEALQWEGDMHEATLLKMEEFAEDIRTWYAVPSDVNSYEISNDFQSYGEIAWIPCVHAQVAILYTNQDPKEFISTWFSKSNYMATYHSNILQSMEVTCGKKMILGINLENLNLEDLDLLLWEKMK
uniref:MULE transposase domain-containing protein n=1 Tax=Lactuca sativa TaxID=4236 RepID=A0A9R1UG40_LACSA|nr:hypothetical protein LSAT_V11C900479900 [Lactuca sativa]